MVPQSSSEFCTALDILFKKPRTGYRSEKVVSALKGSITIRREKSEDDEEASKEDADYASRYRVTHLVMDKLLKTGSSFVLG